MRSELLLSPETLLALIWSAVCFVAGVAFAAYRAVGWADRMRSWAATCPLPTESENP